MAHRMTKKEVEKHYGLPIKGITKEVFWQVWSWKCHISGANSAKKKLQQKRLKVVEIKDRRKLLEYWYAAKHLVMPCLTAELMSIFRDYKCFSHLGALEYYQIANKKGCTPIADIMLYRAGKAFLSFVATEEFARLDIEDLCTLLNYDRLTVNTELEVFYAAVVWVRANVEERQCYLANIYKTLRLSQLQMVMPEVVCQLSFLLPQGSIWRARDFIQDSHCGYIELIREGQQRHITFSLFFGYITYLKNNAEDFIKRVTDN